MEAVDNSRMAAAIPKSKKERIRDNQRRSRARRQEYLADLERRLENCHVICRDADIQHAAITDLQVENARLRELLNYAGISADVFESFGGMSVSAHAGRGTAPAHRQIKPKFQHSIPPKRSDTLVLIKQDPDNASRCSTRSSSSLVCATAPILTTSSSAMYGSQHPASFITTSNIAGVGLSATADVSATSSYLWILDNDPQCSTTPTDASFCCDAFMVPSNGPLLPHSGNMVQCSVAKSMIDREHLPWLEDHVIVDTVIGFD